MPKGCIYANDKDQTEYCPLLNHDDVPFCQYIENEPESAIGIDERPVYCPLSDVPEPCQDAVSRQDAIKTAHLPTIEDAGYEVIRLDDILTLPSAQPEPKRGKWIKMSDADGDYYCCDQCWEELPRYMTEIPSWDRPYPHKQSIDKTDFCPNCGADMRGEQDD